MNGYDIIKSSEAVHGVGSVIWLKEPVVTSPVTSGGQCGGCYYRFFEPNDGTNTMDSFR